MSIRTFLGNLTILSLTGVLVLAGMVPPIFGSVDRIVGSSGCNVNVILNVAPPSGNLGHAIEERLPATVGISNISHDGSVVSPGDGTHRIRWLFFDGDRRVLSYVVDGANGTVNLNGSASFDAVDEPVEGDQQLTISCFSLDVISTGAGDGSVEIDGTLNPLPFTGQFDDQQEVEIAAVPAVGSRFREWGQDLSGSVSPSTVVMSEDRTVAVKFDLEQNLERSIATTETCRAAIVIDVSPPAGTAVQSIEESVPDGLTPFGISGQGVWNSGTHQIRWFFIDGSDRSLTYSVVGDAGVYSGFSGVAAFDTDEVGAQGPDSVSIQCDSSVATVTFDLAQGWNIISVPVAPVEGMDAVLGSRVRGPLRTWNGSAYVSVSTLIAKEGYWVFAPEAATVTVTGLVVLDDRIGLQADLWNLVGPVLDPGVSGNFVSVETAFDVNELSEKPIWGWKDGRFRSTQELELGKGYWVRGK